MQKIWHLHELIQTLDAKHPQIKDNPLITGLSLDSRKVKPGYLFCAFRGHDLDGHKFIPQAIANGAAAILCQNLQAAQETLGSTPETLPPIIEIADISSKLSELGNIFFQSPSSKLDVIGITGTNGKTSISHLIAKALEILGTKAAIIGTLGCGFPNHLDNSINTTPDPITIQEKMAEFYSANTKVVSMEVSSHALVQKRVAAIDFTTAIFTNLTQDHLDYHHTLEEYWRAKKILFQFPSLKNAIINLDDQHGKELIFKLPTSVKTFGYSLNSEQKIEDAPPNLQPIIASDINCNRSGITAHIKTPWGEGRVKSKLLGEFNLSNLLAVVTALGILNIPFADIINTIAKLDPVKGRLQTLGGGKKPLVVIDYAHTPDALEKTLTTLRHHCKGELWCVFGCGGDRDPTKRPIMGQIAERLSDQIIITSDNPRSEDPNLIIQNIVAGLTCPWAAQIEEDRATAIIHAINCATSQDVVLIAGKGHEEYQILSDKRIHFSDIEQAEQGLSRKKNQNL